MTEHIRIRCQVLKTIAAIGPCNSAEAHKQLPHLDLVQVRKACQRLYSEDDELKVVGKEKIDGIGQLLSIYAVRGDDEPKEKKIYKKGSRTTPSNSEHLHRPMRFDKNKGRFIIRYRDRKINLLESLIGHTEGVMKDLLTGIINDLKNA